MPRQQARKQFLNFVGGLNTESSPLLYPENTAKDLDNVDLRRDGSLKRRRGLDFEEGFQYSQSIISEDVIESAAISAHDWESVDGDDTLNFLAVQIGGTLYFHRLGEEVLSTSIMGSIDLSPIRTREDYQEYPLSATVGRGKLFVVSPAISPAYIQYDADTEEFTGVKLTLKIRDTDGIPEEDESPTVFGDDITPTGGTDPVEDLGDTIDDILGDTDWSDYISINIPGL